MSYRKPFPSTPHQMEMFVEAVRLILREGRTVTLQSFCAYTGYKPNHHTKRFLERMVKEDFVTAFSVKFGDGYTRRVYCAQNTRSMFEKSYKSSEIDHNRLMPQTLVVRAELDSPVS